MTDLHMQAMAARQLLAEVRAAGIDDEDVLASAVEGETDLCEAVSGALDGMAALDALDSGAAARIADLSARRERLRARRERIADAVLAALALAGAPLPLRLPEATVTVSRRAPSAIVTDESLLGVHHMTAHPAVDDARHALIEASVSLRSRGDAHAAAKVERAEAGLHALYRPDLREIAARLRAGERVPGAELRNARDTLTIRRK